MAYFPTVINNNSPYYPIGSTPAISFTRNLGLDDAGNEKAKDDPMRVLLLGPGDLRNLLFTIHDDDSLSKRGLDATLCDSEPAVVARNILLLALIVDEPPLPIDHLWDIYYHFRLRGDVLSLFNTKCSSLAALATTLECWSQGPYGNLIKLPSRSTISTLGRLWTQWADESESPEVEAQTALDTLFKNARRDLVKLKDEPEIPLLGLMSLLPGPVENVLTDVAEHHRRYLRTGTTLEKPAENERCPNPAFVAAGGAMFMHHACDPLFGFHLAKQLSPLVNEDSLARNASGGDLKKGLVDAAKEQFSLWVGSFREIIKKAPVVVLRFVVADVLNLCHAIRARNSGAARPVFYRSQWTFATLDVGDGIPASFQVIDTSDLMYQLSGFNLISAAAPLLDRAPNAVLYTELSASFSVKPCEILKQTMGGEMATMSLLLGLYPTEYWSNTASACGAELARLFASLRLKIHDSCRMPLRLAWKRTPTLMTFDGRLLQLQIAPEEVVELLLYIYSNIFMCNITMNTECEMIVIIERAHRCWSRSSMIPFILAAREVVDTSWARAIKIFVSRLRKYQPTPTTMGCLEELCVYLHLSGLYTSEVLAMGPIRTKCSLQGQEVDPARAKPGLVDMPSVVCVTMRVPREYLSGLQQLDRAKVGAPSLLAAAGFFDPSQDITDVPIVGEDTQWLHLFTALQVTFGSMTQHVPYGKVTIAEDRRGWAGRAPLVVSFLVPTWILLRPPREVALELRVTPTAKTNTPEFYTRLGPQLVIYSTMLAKSKHVFVSESWPHRARDAHFRALPLAVNELPAAGPVRQTMMALTDLGRIRSLVGTIELREPAHIEALRAGAKVKVILFQPQGCSVSVLDTDMKTVMCFPCPLGRPWNKESIFPRADKITCVIEVEARIAGAQCWTRHPHFLFPTQEYDGRLYAFHPLPRVDLDRCPVLDVSDPSKLGWLSTHAATMISPREAAATEEEDDEEEEVSVRGLRMRHDIKKSLADMFERFAGLKGAQHPLAFAFGVTNDEALGKGAPKFLLIPRALCFDHNNQSVVLDAAFLAIRKETSKTTAMTVVLLKKAGLLFHVPAQLEEIVLWKAMMPACADRCRDWKHREDCDYVENATASIMNNMERMLCTCGEGEFPDGWEPEMTAAQWGEGLSHENMREMAIDRWEEGGVKKLVTRVAIPLIFSSAAVDWHAKQIKKVEEVQVKKCQVCEKKHGSGADGALKHCLRCESVYYCSRECLKADWKRHKPECKLARKRETEDVKKM